MIIIQQLITAMLGSLGFALIFHVSKKYLISAAFGGFVCYEVILHKHILSRHKTSPAAIFPLLIL